MVCYRGLPFIKSIFVGGSFTNRTSPAKAGLVCLFRYKSRPKQIIITNVITEHINFLKINSPIIRQFLCLDSEDKRLRKATAYFISEFRLDEPHKAEAADNQKPLKRAVFNFNVDCVFLTVIIKYGDLCFSYSC